MATDPKNEAVDYDALADAFNQALIHTLRKHSIADTILDYWVPDADPVLGITGMADSARIAGLTEIAIRFRRTTVPEGRLPDLQQAIGRFAKVALERHGDSMILRASAMAKPAGGAGERRKDVRPDYWHAGKVPGSRSEPPTAAFWASDILPEFGDAHPDFRPSLQKALAGLLREGVDASATNDFVRAEGRDGAVRLALDVDPRNHTVKAARHAGATKPSERAALDLFCRAAENLPLQEVADHVGLKVVDTLVDQDKAPPVRGVLLPVNAGAPFLIGPRLARQAYDAYRAAQALPSEANFYYAPPSPSWQALSSAERRQRVTEVMRGFLQSEDLYQDDIELLRLEKNKTGYEVRGVVGFSERVKVDDKPFLMRRIEQRLRRDVEPELELVADRARDSSPLRRLS